MHLLAAQPTSSEQWWWSTLTSDQGLVYLAILLGCVALLALMVWRLRKANMAEGPRRTLRQRLADESGTATIECVLVTPFLLLITLILVQTTLVFTGLFYVNYAAYAAARSAIVYVPTDLGEDRNVLSPVEGAPKFDRIRSAAIVALIPVSGEEAGELAVGTLIVNAMRQAHEDMGLTPPGWVDNLLLGRVNYATNHTDLTVYEVEVDEFGDVSFYAIGGTHEFGPKDPIAVEVRHEMALTIPVASQIFTLAGDSGTYQTMTRSSNSPGPPGRWTAVTARYLLTNQGIDRQLPAAPPVPRRP